MQRLFMNGPFLKTLFYENNMTPTNQDGISYLAFVTGVWLEQKAFVNEKSGGYYSHITKFFNHYYKTYFDGQSVADVNKKLASTKNIPVKNSLASILKFFDTQRELNVFQA